MSQKSSIIQLPQFVPKALTSDSATAQTVCSQRGTFLEHLSNRYSEVPIAMGLSAEGSVLEILASDTGSWTLIVTRPSGVSCVVAHGQGWESMPKVVSGPAT